MENGGGNWCEPQFYKDLTQKKITFKANMEGVDVSHGVYISGDWLGDSLDFVPMAPEGDGIYSYFTYISSGSTGSYFFLNDTTWESVEPVPAACGNVENEGRSYQVGETDQTYSYQWGTCNPAEIPSLVNVTFRVKMEEGADLTRGYMW